MTQHIHVVSGGSSVYNSFKLAVRKFPMDNEIIVIEKNVFENLEDPNFNEDKKKELKAISDAIIELEFALDDLGIQHSRYLLEDSSLNSLSDMIIDIYSKYKDSHFYFNVTGGKRVIPFRLFMFANWLGGTSYYADIENSHVEVFNVPKIHLEDIRKNPNYMIILESIYEKGQSIKYTDLFSKTAEKYIPMRQKKVENEKLQRGTFSKLKESLISFGLIEEEYLPDNKRNKIISLTYDGKLAYKLLKVVEEKN